MNYGDAVRYASEQAEKRTMAGALTGFLQIFIRAVINRLLRLLNLTRRIVITERQRQMMEPFIRLQKVWILLCTIGWNILSDYADDFVSIPDWIAAKGMRVLGNPLRDDPRVISGESGAATIGLVTEILHNPTLGWLKDVLKLDKASRILCLSTEGNTDRENYRRIVWDGAISNCEWLKNGVQTAIKWLCLYPKILSCIVTDSFSKRLIISWRMAEESRIEPSDVRWGFYCWQMYMIRLWLPQSSPLSSS